MRNRIASSILLICFILMAVGLTGCLKDSLCLYGMQIAVITENQYKKVEPVSLYIFRENGAFYEKQVASLDPESSVATFSLNHLPNGNYQLVVWGNCKEGSTMPDFTEGTSIEDLSFCLTPESEETYCTPEELFYGVKKITRSNTEPKNDEVLISRCISGIVVKLSGAQQTPESEKEYYVTVEGTLHTIPFWHQLTEGVIYPADDTQTVLYRLPFQWDNKLLTTGVRYIFPSGDSQKITVRLFQNDKLIKEYPLTVSAVVNKIIEVNLDVKTAGDWFQINEWNSIGQEEEM